ncbi:MAG: type II toxin-antitoxin system RelE/ParE family toxin [Magnetospirillum sp.]|nr:MAG: type II toxin-antitoxin system RelE/ParE family toxin [Magnetospirillum sp.]
MPEISHSLLAEQDLIDLWRHVASDNVAAANELLRLIDKTCSVLAEHPLIGRDRGNILDGMFPLSSEIRGPGEQLSSP